MSFCRPLSIGSDHHLLRTKRIRFILGSIVAYSWNGFGQFYFLTMGALSQRDGNNLFLHHFAARLLTSSTHQKVDQMYGKTYPHMGSWSSSPNHLQNRLSTVILNNIIMAATQQQPKMRRSLPSQTPLAVSNSFHLLYLPFCVVGEPLSNTSCRSGVLIVSYLCTGNDRRDTIGSCQWLVGGCKYYLLLNKLTETLNT